VRSVEVLAAPHGEIALGDPRGRAVADGGQLIEACLRMLEHGLRLVQALLLEEGTAEDELGVADLVEVIDTAVQ